ncbi:STAS domain-containing protein [Actinoplanes sp. NPDC051494]|uniref:STAS domain-containing protein n=1 Tax=Actinoplanes sp. NPDC051494 TaxID=3363907 RepID=UPI0037BCAA1B
MTEPSFQIAREAGVVRLAGEFDINSRDELRDALVAAVRESPDGSLAVDFSATEFMDSEALGALIEGFNAGQRAGVKLAIVDARGLVRRVLDVSGLLELFD